MFGCAIRTRGRSLLFGTFGSGFRGAGSLETRFVVVACSDIYVCVVVVVSVAKHPSHLWKNRAYSSLPKVS